MARDSQRSRMYSAEKEATYKCKIVYLDSIHDIRDWVNKIVDSRWFQFRWPVECIRVTDGRRRSSACGSAQPDRIFVRADRSARYFGWKGTIKLPKWARYQMVVLHEIAHVVTDQEYKRSDGIAAHGPEFCSNLLQLVRRWMGAEAHATLKESFKNGRVKHTKRSRYEKS